MTDLAVEVYCGVVQVSLTPAGRTIRGRILAKPPKTILSALNDFEGCPQAERQVHELSSTTVQATVGISAPTKLD
jgi:hypothetical protein